MYQRTDSVLQKRERNIVIVKSAGVKNRWAVKGHQCQCRYLSYKKNIVSKIIVHSAHLEPPRSSAAAAADSLSPAMNVSLTNSRLFLSIYHDSRHISSENKLIILFIES